MDAWNFDLQDVGSSFVWGVWGPGNGALQLRQVIIDQCQLDSRFCNFFTFYNFTKFALNALLCDVRHGKIQKKETPMNK